MLMRKTAVQRELYHVVQLAACVGAIWIMLNIAQSTQVAWSRALVLSQSRATLQRLSLQPDTPTVSRGILAPRLYAHEEIPDAAVGTLVVIVGQKTCQYCAEAAGVWSGASPTDKVVWFVSLDQSEIAAPHTRMASAVDRNKFLAASGVRSVPTAFVYPAKSETASCVVLGVPDAQSVNECTAASSATHTRFFRRSNRRQPVTSLATTALER